MPQDMAGTDRFSSRITEGGSYSRQGRKASMQVSELPFQANEAINTLRGNLQLSGYNVKVIAVTSALIHEGKSSIAFRLAKSFAGLGKKTIFVDCDIRNSHIITRYQVEGVEYGLSEFLSGNTYMLNIVYQTDDENLDIIFPGASAPNPSELFSGEMFSNLLQLCRSHYD